MTTESWQLAGGVLILAVGAVSALRGAARKPGKTRVTLGVGTIVSLLAYAVILALLS